MANITKRGDTYKITVSVGRDLNGNQLRKCTTFKPTATTPAAIKKEVDTFAMDFERLVKEGKYLDGEHIKFADFVQNHWMIKVANNFPQHRKEEYTRTLEKRIFPYIGNLKMSKITALHITDMYDDLIKKYNLTPATIHKYHSTLSSVMSYAYRMDVIKENPLNKVSRRDDLPSIETDDKLHFFTVEQVKTFLNDALTKTYDFDYKSRKRTDKDGNIYNVKEYSSMHKIPYQWRVYFNLAIYGGFRRGELIALTWEDIDFNASAININKSVSEVKGDIVIKAPKTKAGNRVVTIPKTCVQVLRKWKAQQQELCLSMGTAWQGFRGNDFDKNPVFIQLENGKRMHLSTPTHKFKEILSLYNSTCDNESDKLPIIRLHDLRHTTATLLIAGGHDIVTVSKRLGHSKPSVTTDVYAHWLKDNDKKAADLLEKMLS